MHPSCLEHIVPSSGRERLASIPQGKPNVARPLPHKQPRPMIEDQIMSKLVAHMDGRPVSFRHLIRRARAWLRGQKDRYELSRY